MLIPFTEVFSYGNSCLLQFRLDYQPFSAPPQRSLRLGGGFAVKEVQRRDAEKRGGRAETQPSSRAHHDL